MQTVLRKALLLLAPLPCLLAGGALAGEAGTAWQLTPRIEHSRVQVNGNDGRWNASSLEVAREAAPGQWLRASVGRQDRNGLADTEVHVAADIRAGEWNATASMQLSPDPVFLPEWSYQVRAERAVSGRVRVGGGYRRMQFNDSGVKLASAHATFNRGDDELGVEYRFGRNAVLDHDIRVLQLRAVKFSGRNQYAVYLARGDYLFDALGIPGGSGEGWSANLAYARSLSPSTTLRLEAGAGGETDTFRQRSMAVSLHYRP